MNEIKARLEQLAEPKYKVFSEALTPNAPEMLGVRLPILRGIAKEFVKDAPEILQQPCGETFEEIMLRGMLIGYMKCTSEQRLEAIREFIPMIDNWSVCDTFCAGIKEAKRQQELYWNFIQPYLRSAQEFEVRFAVVMLLDHFTYGEWVPKTLAQLQAVTHNGYYVKMAVGWAISICYIHAPDITWTWLNQTQLDAEISKIALQKIMDSKRVQGEQRERIRQLREQRKRNRKTLS